MLKQLRKESGFTIIELLIVIAIIGILATLVLTNFQGAQAKGRDTVRKNDINSLYQKLEEYYNENGSYINESITTTSTAAPVDNSNATTLFPGIDLGAVIDEDGKLINTTFTDSTTAPTPSVDNTSTDAVIGGEYELALYGTGCTNGNTANACVKYELAAYQETTDGNAPYEKTSLN
jgi:prepilin-type N-terminal cleavage/methylation domain-containing protein